MSEYDQRVIAEELQLANLLKVVELRAHFSRDLVKFSVAEVERIMAAPERRQGLR